MTNKAVEILRNVYHINTPINLIPHGIPKVSFEDQMAEKIKLGYEGKIILSSFGMISAGGGVSAFARAKADQTVDSKNDGN